MALLFSLVPNLTVNAAVADPDILSGRPVIQVNSSQFSNPANATDANDSTFTSMWEFYHNYGLTFNTPTANISKIRIVVDDYHKMQANGLVVFWTTDGAGQNNRWVSANDTTMDVNLKNVYMISVTLGDSSVVSSSNPLKLYTIEAYAMDLTPPTVPVITSHTIGNGQVSLDWSASSDTDGVSGYKIYQDGGYIDEVNGSTTTYTAVGLSNADTHSYQVSATDTKANESARSDAVLLRSNNSIPPTKPVNLEGVASSNTVALSWEPAIETDIEGYNIYVDGEQYNEDLVSGNSYNINGLTNGTSYAFTVEAVNTSGIASAISDTTTVIPSNAPAKITGVGVTSDDTTATVTWNESGYEDLKGYDVYMDGVKVTSEPVTGFTYTVTGLKYGTKYNFEVTASNLTDEESVKSDAASITIVNPNPPASPSGVSVVSGSQHAVVSWTANTESDLAGYEIYNGNVLAGQVNANATSYDVTGLTNDITYSLKVLALNTSHKSSDFSEAVLVTPLSDHSKLATLTMGGGTLTPVFSPTELNYTVHVANDVASVTFTPTVAERYETVKVNGVEVGQNFIPGMPSFPGMPPMPGMPGMPPMPGTPDTLWGNTSEQLPVHVGTNIIDIAVTAKDGKTVSHYVVTIYKAGSLNSGLSDLTTSIGTLDPLFNVNESAYFLAVDADVSSMKVTPTVADSHASVFVNGVAVTSGDNSLPIDLNVGDNAIEVKVTEEDGTSKTYTVNVTRAALPIPSDITNLVETHTTTTANFTFSLPTDRNFSKVNIYMNDNAVNTVTSGVYNVINLTPNTSYTFLFKAVNEAGAESVGVTHTVKTDAITPPVDPPVVIQPDVTPVVTPAPTATPAPTSAPTPAPTPVVNQDKPVFNDKVNVGAIRAIAEKAQNTPPKPFSDVPAQSWSAATIDLATRMGIVSGDTNGTFNPTKLTTRAEFATMFVNALGLTPSGTSSFSDAKGHWAEDAIQALKSNGIISGYGDGSFKPDQTISRAEIVTMIIKVMTIKASTSGNQFSDVKGNWAQNAINAAADAGIISGTGNGKFDPNANATKEQSVTMIIRMLNVTLDLGLKL